MGNKSALTFLFEQLSPVPPVETADLSGKIVVVTGANTGIGYETAKHCAKMGAEKVILACRSQGKGEDALKRLKDETGYSRAELRLLDQSSFASVKAFVDQFDAENDRLDLLIANAGVIPATYEETEDGWEQSIQVNHIAPALLILLLLPKVFKATELALPNTPAPRIVVVASEVHQAAVVPPKVFDAQSVLEAISSKELSLPYDATKKYHLAKLLNVFFTRAFASHLPQSSPVVNCVNPGFCKSELIRSIESWIHTIMIALLARTSEQGARQLIWAAVGTPTKADLGGVGEGALRGAYVSFLKTEEPADFVISEKGKEFERALWADTLRVLSKLDDRIQPVIEKYLRN